MIAALYAGLFGFLGFEAAVARIDIAFEHNFGIGQRHGVYRARLTSRTGAPCTAEAMPISSHPIGRIA